MKNVFVLAGLGVLAWLIFKPKPAEASDNPEPSQNENFDAGDLSDLPPTTSNPGDGWTEATPETVDTPAVIDVIEPTPQPVTFSTKYAVGDKIQLGTGNVWLITGIDNNKYVRPGETGAYLLISVWKGLPFGEPAYESFKMADQFYVKVG